MPTTAAYLTASTRSRGALTASQPSRSISPTWKTTKKLVSRKGAAPECREYPFLNTVLFLLKAVLNSEANRNTKILIHYILLLKHLRFLFLHFC